MLIKKNKIATLRAMQSTTDDATTDSARCSGPDEKIPRAPQTNKIAGFFFNSVR